MRRFILFVGLAACLLGFVEPLRAFCGFYVAKADTSLFNRASQVVLVRDGDRTVLTMASDFKGDAEGIRRRHSRADVHHARADPRRREGARSITSMPTPRRGWSSTSTRIRAAGTRCAHAMPRRPAGRGCRERERRADAALGVTIEAQYTVGEYDILILSAKQSGGLETWLTENGYRIPAGAGPVIGSYLRQNMRFFVARVNLSEQARLGFSYLRPLQVAYESPKFMLPIRLGTVNANGPQELFIYTLTRTGRVETTNYRTVKLPTGTRAAGRTSRMTSRASTARCSSSRSGASRCRRCSSSTHGTWRWCDPVRSRSDVRGRRAEDAGRVLARRRRANVPRAGHERVRHAPARPLRRAALP